MSLRKPYSSRWRAACIGLFVSLITFLLTRNDLFEGLEWKTLDLWFHLRGPHPPNPSVVIAAIDDLSSRELGDPPWPRYRFARLVHLLHKARARVIVFDTMMAAADPAAAENDQSLAQAIEEAGNVLLPSYFSRASAPGLQPEIPAGLPVDCEYLSRPRRILNKVGDLSVPYAPLRTRAAGAGHINVYPERDGVVRKAPLIIDYGGKPYPSLALQAARMSVGWVDPIRVRPGKYVEFAGLKIPLDPAFETMMNFAGGYKTFRYYSIANILSGKVPLKTFRDKIVLIGSTTAQQSSFFPTPFSQVFPGVEIQATVVDNILENRSLQRAAFGINFLLLMFIGPALGFVLADQRPHFSWIYAVAVAGSIAFTVFYLFATRLVWVDCVRPLSALFWTYMIVLIYRLRLGEQETARTQSVIETLMQVSSIIGSSLDQRRLLQLFIEWGTQLVSAEAGSILLFDESQEYLSFAVATGEKSASVEHYTLKAGEGIAGWVAQRGEPVICNDVQQDARFKRDIAEEIGFPTRAILCVPLRAKNTISGVIEVLNRKDGMPFTQDDQELLTAMANQAGVALENAQLYALLERRVELANSRLIEANQELTVEKGKLEAIVRSMSDGVVVLDARESLIFANPAARLVFDIPSEEDSPLTDQRIDDLFPQENLLQGIHDALQKQTEVEIKEIQIGQTRPRVFSVHLAPIQESPTAALGVVAVFSDITELKELDRAKNDFVSFVSHELRSPITAIKGFASTLLRADMADPESQVEFLTIIAQECDRMTRLTSSILDLSRIEAGRALELHRQPVNLPDMLQRVVDRNRLYATKHEFSLAVDGDMPRVLVDADKMEQVLTNLVSNAIKYSPRGGGIQVQAGREDSRVVVSIRDHGVGIPKEQIGRLFQRYHRVGGESTRRISGTGLGLYLTRHLIIAHGGDIWVESQEGEGSTFSFSLPLTENTVAVEER